MESNHIPIELEEYIVQLVLLENSIKEKGELNYDAKSLIELLNPKEYPDSPNATLLQLHLIWKIFEECGDNENLSEKRKLTIREFCYQFTEKRIKELVQFLFHYYC